MASSYRTLLAVAATLTLPLVAGCGRTADQGSAVSVSTTARSGGATSPATSIVCPSAGTAGKLTETGSSLLFPLFQAWASAYHSVTITPASTRSGTGIACASAGKADIGASDAFLSSGNLVQNPNLLNIPLVISAQQINYNLPKVSPSTHVKLSGAILAQMYEGTITTWNNQQIQALNPGISLPSTKVVPLYRSDSSGDTFLFSSYLSSTYPAWSTAIGYGTLVAWPTVPGAMPETSNGDMVAGCQSTPGCVAYIGISYLSKALAAGLGEAELENASGAFLLPDPASMREAVDSFLSAIPPNETISMVNGPAKAGYPIVNFEYAIVAKNQPDPAKARDIKSFLQWAITTGNATGFLHAIGFQPLPAPIVTLADDQIARIR